MPTSRRKFLGESVFVLAGATAGVFTLTGCTSPGKSTEPMGPPRTLGRFSAGLGWTVKGLEDDSAFAYLEVARPLTLAGVHIDASFVPAATGAAASSAQAMCQAWVSRGAPPAFPNGGGGAVGPTTTSADFGGISVYNPAGLTVHVEDAPRQDVFYRSLLRSQASPTGVGSAVAGAVYGLPSLVLEAGDYLVFGIEHSGVTGAVQLQACLDCE
jgi:hypothetical protein